MYHPHVTILADRQMTARRITEQAADRAAAARLARAPLPAVAARLADRLREHFDPATLPVQQVLALAEEAGEFTAAYRRWAGLARRTGPWHDVEAELADVVITAYVTAARARHRPGRRRPRQDRSRVHPRLARTPARRLTPPTPATTRRKEHPSWPTSRPPPSPAT